MRNWETQVGGYSQLDDLCYGPIREQTQRGHLEAARAGWQASWETLVPQSRLTAAMCRRVWDWVEKHSVPLKPPIGAVALWYEDGDVLWLYPEDIYH